MNPDKRAKTEAIAKHNLQCELHGIPITLPAAAKYKRDRYEKKDGPQLEVGMKAVIAVDRGGERVGYYLGVLVDWCEPEERKWWTHRTELYFVVLANSNSKIADRKGRIVSARWPAGYWCELSVEYWGHGKFSVAPHREGR